jgi:WD40 repeat protein
MFEARAKVRASLELQDSVGARALWHALAADPLLWRRPIWANAEARIAWAPDGSRVAVAIGGGWFYVVDPATGEARQLRSGGGGVFSVAFSPDGRRFLQACADGKVSLVDPETGEEKKVLYRRPDPGGAIADCAPDGRRILVTAVNGPVLLVDAASGEVVLAPEIGNATSATIDAGGALLAVGRYDGTIDVLEVPSGAPRATLRGHDGVVLGVAFDASGGRLASVGKDRTVRLWDVARGAQLGSTPCQPESVRGHDLRFEGERLLAACAGPDSIRLVDGSIGRLVRELGRDVEMPSGVAFAPDGKRLFAAGLNEIRVWDLTRPEPSGTQAGHDKSVMTLAFSPDGLLVASAALDGTIRLWDADSGEPRGTLLGHEGNIYAVGFSPDGARLASGGQDQLIHVWDVRSLTSAYELRGHTDVVWSLAFTPDGRLLASASNDRTVRLWDVATGAALGVLEGHEGSVRAVAIRPDGRELASGAADKTVRLWELPSGRPLRTLRGHEGRVFSVVYGPDGRTPASMGIDGTIRLWNVADGAARLFAGAEKLRAGLPPGTPLSILDAAFDPTGRTLAATVGGGYVLWNVADGAETGRLAWLSGAGTRIRFSGDGRRLAVTDNTVVRLFDAATLRPVWHAPVLLHGPARLRTHRGWIGLDAPDLAVGLAPTAWRSAVEERALFAEETPDGRLLCLLTFDGSLEVWSPERDERVREEAIGRPALAFAVGGGCATVSEGKARFFPREGDPVLLSDRAASIDVSRDEIFVSTGREILTFDDGGAPKATYAQPGIIAAVTRLGSALALGFQEGPIEIRGVEGRAGAPPVVLQDTPTQPPARMLALPGGLLAAAFLNGFVGIWNPLDGELLMSAKLNGPAMHLRLDRDVEAERDYLYAASDLGDYARLDVGVFREDYCRLLREVWTRVSTSWEGGRAVPATPPERHRCAGP